jgi:hypothetical protein
MRKHVGDVKMDIQLRNNQNLQNIRIVLLDENRMPRSCTVCGFFFVGIDIKKKVQATTMRYLQPSTMDI